MALGRFGHFVFFRPFFFRIFGNFFFQSTLVLLSNPPLNTISVVFFLSYLGWKSWKKIRIIKVFLFFFKKKRCSKRAPQPSTRFCRRVRPFNVFLTWRTCFDFTLAPICFVFFYFIPSAVIVKRKKNCEAKKKKCQPCQEVFFCIIFLLGFKECSWVLLGFYRMFTGFYWVSMNVTWFYWVLQNVTGFD